MHDDDDNDHVFDGPSKSALKREMHALQAIGERLVTLSDAQLAKFPIADESLRDAVLLARKITSHSGRKRQLQFIGKLMRRIDPTPLIEAFDIIDNQHQASAARFHALEQLRDDLLKRGDNAIEDVVTKYPEADRSHLRQLLRSQQKAVSQGKNDGSAKKLFRYLRELDDQATGDAQP
jgi:ribosome-associated protein